MKWKKPNGYYIQFSCSYYLANGEKSKMIIRMKKSKETDLMSTF